jgi:hypothetical protein
MSRLTSALLCAALLGLALVSPASAAGEASVTAGGLTDQACTGQGSIAPIVVTPSAAYASGNAVGGIVTISAMFRQGRTGILQSTRINIKSVQTAEFDIYQFTALPATTINDKATPSLSTADALLVWPPIKLTNNDSTLGTMTVYGSDQLAAARKSSSQSDWFLVVTKGTPTFTTASDVQLCVAYLLDF